MNITLKYFSWIRVKLKKSHDLIEISQTISFKELKKNLISKDAIYQEIFEDKSVKFFLNLCLLACFFEAAYSCMFSFVL